MGKVKVGIIGAGNIGRLHANNILHSEKLELTMIADVYTDHLKGTRFEEQVPKITKDPQELINDKEIQLVLICSLTNTHAEYIKAAARAGKHVFCEKPISFNIEETKEVRKIIQETGVKFQVGFNRRFDKHFRKVYETVRAGTVGDPHIIKVTSRDPAPPPENYIPKSGGMFMDMTIHDFDIIRYLSGSEVTEVTVNAANLVDPMFERHGDVDTAIITLQFENGSLGVIDNSRQAVYGYDQRIEVFGNKGAVSAENESKTNIRIATEEAVTLDVPKHFYLDRYQEAYVEEIHQLADAILEDKPTSCSVEDGYQAELMAFAANISHKEKRTVRIAELQEGSLV